MAGLGLLTLGLAARFRDPLAFYARLLQARRVADRFYNDCATLNRDIAFLPGNSARLDVYQPAGANNCPVLVYVYGGSWNSGNKELYAPIAQRLLPEGLVVVLPDYSRYPAGGYPTQSRQIAAAIAWTLDNIDRFGGDPRRVVVAGQSAGGHVASLALFDPQFLAAHGRRASDIRGFIGISGVYDAQAQVAYERRKRGYAAYVIKVMGGEANLEIASPIRYAGANTPPALLIHGDADTTVPVQMSFDLHARLQSAGVSSRLNIYPRGGHSGLLFEALASNPARLTTEIVEFVRQVTGEPVAA